MLIVAFERKVSGFRWKKGRYSCLCETVK